VSGKDISDGRPATRILAVDDDPILRDIMQAKLGDAGYQVLQAENGETAWQIAETEPFDLGIIDLAMPGLDGFALIDYFRQSPRTVDTPLIVLTSRTDEDAIKRAFEAGASNFATKPVHWPLFMHQIRFALKMGDTAKALRSANESVLASNGSMNNLMTFLSANLRASLDQVFGSYDLLRSEISRDISADQRQHLEAGTLAFGQLRHLVDDALLYSRLFSADFHFTDEEIPVNDLLEDAIAAAQKTVGKTDLSLVARQYLEDLAVLVDPGLIVIAIARLMRSAARHSQPGGTIELRAAQQDDRGLILSVRDNRPSVDRTDVEMLARGEFLRSSSYARTATRPGLSLPIAERIAKLHQGRLVQQNLPSGGCVTAIVLPGERVRPGALPEAAAAS